MFVSLKTNQKNLHNFRRETCGTEGRTGARKCPVRCLVSMCRVDIEVGNPPKPGTVIMFCTHLGQLKKVEVHTNSGAKCGP